MTRWSDVPAWDTRTGLPSGEPQYFRCPDAECAERATYPNDNPRNHAWCPVHHERMNVEVDR